MDESKMSPQQLKDAAMIRHTQQLITSLYNNQNMYEASQMFTKDCILSFHLTPYVRGRAGTQTCWTSVLDRGFVHLEYYVEEFLILRPDMAIVRDTGIQRNEDGEELGRLKGFKMWKKVDGQWLVHIHVVQPADIAGSHSFLKQQ